MTTGQSSAGWHGLALFMECPRKFAYRERLGLRSPVEPDATALGTCVHTMLEAHYVAPGSEEAALVGLGLRYAHAFADARRVYEAHQARWEPKPGELGFEVLGVERELTVTIGGHTFTRRVDLILRKPDGSAWVLDHKTAGRPVERVRYANLDLSLMTQELVAQHTVPGYAGLILNAIPTGDGPHIRQPIRFPPRMLAELPAELKVLLDWRRSLASVSPWLYPKTGQCLSRWGRCEYTDLCVHGRAALGEFEAQ